MIIPPTVKLFQHGLVRLRVGDMHCPGLFFLPPCPTIRYSLPLLLGADRSFTCRCIHNSAVAEAFSSQSLDHFVIQPCIDGVECSGMHIILVRHGLKGCLLICCDQLIR
jgi:hypothetical protein